MGWLTSLYAWIGGVFWSKHAEICVVGLQASGKTSFINLLSNGQWSEEVVPTISFNMRKVKKGNVSFKIWDVAGQAKFRSTWVRYCAGADAMVFVVDSHDKASFDTARYELQALLKSPYLNGVALLVLGNKNDLDGHADVEELIQALELHSIQSRPVSCYSCSMKSQHNMEIVMQWLSERGH